MRRLQGRLQDYWREIMRHIAQLDGTIRHLSRPHRPAERARCWSSILAVFVVCALGVAVLWRQSIGQSKAAVHDL